MAASGGRQRRVYLLAIWFAVLTGLIVFAVVVDDVSPVVYFALYTVAFLGYARYLRRHDNAFMWRHGIAASDGIRVDLGPERIRAVIETELERQGSWDVTGLEVGVDARRGMTVSSFATRLLGEWHPSGGGEWVTVTSRMPVLADWGANKRVVARVVDALRSADSHGRGADDSSQDTKPV